MCSVLRLYEYSSRIVSGWFVYMISGVNIAVASDYFSIRMYRTVTASQCNSSVGLLLSIILIDTSWYLVRVFNRRRIVETEIPVFLTMKSCIFIAYLFGTARLASSLSAFPVQRQVRVRYHDHPSLGASAACRCDACMSCVGYCGIIIFYLC